MNKLYDDNRALWDARTEVHLQSEFYDQESFLKGRNSLNPVELELLGDLNGKSAMHLQCHFGQDSLSMARMGAKVTGVDFSPKAVEAAGKMADSMELDARFILSNVLELDLEEQFDIVFTSYGTVGWLSDISKWGEVVGKHLKPGGKLIMVEFHPMLWSKEDNFQFDYISTEPISEEEGSYTDGSENMQMQSRGWNHGLASVIEALLAQDLRMLHFGEHNYSPYDCFSNLVKGENGFFIEGLEGKIPMLYSLVFEKR